MVRPRQCTKAQEMLAAEYGIPTCQAWTINERKVIEYRQWRCSPEQRLEYFMDNLEIYRAVLIRDE